MTRPVGIIGFGAIAQDLVAVLAAHSPRQALSVLVRPGRAKKTREALVTAPTPVTVFDRFSDFMQGAPGIVAECAGHGAVSDYGRHVLEAGADFITASVGALADGALYADLKAAAEQSAGQLVIPSGAIGGVDALSAARLSGLTAVKYTGRKPPLAWAGTPAEATLDLARITTPTPFFTGSARQAAQAYPKNANVAATLALAGMGMDDTQVTLVADPTTTENVHEFSISSPALEADIRLVGKPSARNPKTSQTTVLSIARAILNRDAAIVI